MPDPDAPNPNDVEELATLLDSVTAGVAPARVTPIAATIAVVHGGNRSAASSPAFRASLKEHVVGYAASASVSSPITGPSSNGRRAVVGGPGETLVGPRPPRRLPAAGGRRRALAEFVGLTALVAVIFAQAMGAGGNVAFWWQETSPAPAADGAPGMERGNAARTGEYTVTGPEQNPFLAWRREELAIEAGESSLRFSSPPVLAGEDVFALNDVEGKLYRISIVDGRWTSLWASLGSVQSSGLAVDDETVYVATAGAAMAGTGPGFLIALDRSTLEERWRVETGGVGNSSLAVEDGRVIVLAVGGDAVAYGAADGAELWRTPIDVSGDDGVAGERVDPWYLFSDGGPAVADGTVYVSAGTRDLVALDAETGAQRWIFTAETARLGTPAVRDGAVYVVARDGGERQRHGEGALYRIDAATGREVWRWPIPMWDLGVWGTVDSAGLGEPSYEDALSVTVDGDHAYVLDTGARGNALAAVNVADGSVAWTVEMPRAGGSAPTVAGGTLYLGREDGGIYALATTDGRQRWRLDTGRRFLASPAVAEGRLVAMSMGGVLFGIGSSGRESTPVAGIDPTDISGLGPCVPPRSLPDLPPSGGTELPSVVDALGIEPVNGIVGFADLPTVPAANGGAILSILRTLRELSGCSRPGREEELAAFYSDDYLRRASVMFGPTGMFVAMREPLRVAVGDIMSLPEPVRLPDDRVGLLFVDELSGTVGTLVVFVERDGSWLIDDMVSTAEDPTASRG